MSFFNELMPIIREISNNITEGFNDDLKAAFECFDKFEEEIENERAKAREKAEEKVSLPSEPEPMDVESLPGNIEVKQDVNKDDIAMPPPLAPVPIPAPRSTRSSSRSTKQIETEDPQPIPEGRPTRTRAKKEEEPITQIPPDRIVKPGLSAETLAKMNNMIFFNGKQISSSASKPRSATPTAKPILPASASEVSGINKAREEAEAKREREDARKKKEAMLEAKRDLHKNKPRSATPTAKPILPASASEVSGINKAREEAEAKREREDARKKKEAMLEAKRDLHKNKPRSATPTAKPRSATPTAKPILPASASEVSGINKAREEAEAKREREDARKKKEAMLEAKRDLHKNKPRSATPTAKPILPASASEVSGINKAREEAEAKREREDARKKKEAMLEAKRDLHKNKPRSATPTAKPRSATPTAKPRSATPTAKPILPASASEVSGINKAREEAEAKREREDARKKKEAMLEAKRDLHKKKREEKMAAAAAAREAAEKDRKVAMELAAKEHMEKQVHAYIGKLERLKEKKQELARKEACTEERRKAEEIARQQRLADEQRRAEDARRKQFEEAAALKIETAIMAKEMKEYIEKQKLKRLEEETHTPIKTPGMVGYHGSALEPVYMADGFQYLNSDEDDEETVNKPVPDWCTSKSRKKQLSIQCQISSSHIDRFFNVLVHTPDLRDIFPNIERARLKRTSSAVWRTPPNRLAAVTE